MPGFLAVLVAKLAGLGAVTKVAAATTTAALTMALGAGTGILPLSGGTAGSTEVAQVAVAQAMAEMSSATASLPSSATGGTPARAAAAATVASPAASSSAKAGAVVPQPAAAVPAKAPGVPTVANIASPVTPALPALPGCVADLLPTGGTAPDPMRLVSQLPACIVSVVSARLPLDTIEKAIGAANLPVEVSRCLSRVLSAVPGFVAGDLSGLPGLLAACLPTGPIAGTGSIPGAGAIPGIGSLAGRAGR